MSRSIRPYSSAVQIGVRPEQRSQRAFVGGGEQLRPVVLGEVLLEEQGVDEHERRLQQMQRQHRHFFHSGAGPLLVAMGQSLGCVEGYVFVDAGLPHPGTSVASGLAGSGWA